MGEFLQYLVSLYGSELYENRQKLNNLIADLYQGDERLKRAYRRAIMDDTLAQRVYELSLKPLNEREAYRNQIVAQFSEANFYSSDFGKQIVDSFISGLRLEILPPIISTVATEEDGEWVDEYGVVYSVDRKKLIRGKSLSNYTVKEGTVVVCDGAFQDCNFLCRLTLPTSLTSIGNWTFYDCSSLLSLTLPSSLKSIGDGAFVDCRSLSSLTFPSSLTSIGDSAFSGCGSLSGLTLPVSLTSIGNWAFSDCSSLRNLTLPVSLTSVGDCAFRDCRSLSSLTLPTSLTSIGEYAFYGCSSLQTIYIPIGSMDKFKKFLPYELYDKLTEI